MFSLLAIFFGAILVGNAWVASGSGRMRAGHGRFVTFKGDPLEFGFYFVVSVALGIALCVFGLMPLIS